MGRKKGPNHGVKRHKGELWEDAHKLLETLRGLTHESSIDCLSRVFSAAARPEILKLMKELQAELGQDEAAPAPVPDQ